MSISRIKQIKRIIAECDVRDPRAALVAIEKVLSQEKPKKAKPQKPKPQNQIMGFEMVGTPIGSIIAISFDQKNINARHVLAAKQALDDFAKDMFPECDGDCDNCGTGETNDLSELFKKFEADLVKKGGLH